MVVTVGQGPILFSGVEQKAEDVERKAVLLVTGALVRADEHAALKLWISQHHDLRRDSMQVGYEFINMEGK